MASSRGVPTVCASTAGFAPGYTARTVMVGGVTSGYSLTGSAKTAIKPAARTTSDSTTAKTGREELSRVGHDGAHADGAGRAVEAVVDEIERALVGECGLVREPDRDRA